MSSYTPRSDTQLRAYMADPACPFWVTDLVPDLTRRDPCDVLKQLSALTALWTARELELQVLSRKGGAVMTATTCQCEHISHFPEYSARMRELGVKAAHEYGKAEVHGLYSVKTTYGPYALCPDCKDAGHMGYKGEVQS